MFAIKASKGASRVERAITSPPYAAEIPKLAHIVGKTFGDNCENFEQNGRSGSGSGRRKLKRTRTPQTENELSQKNSQLPKLSRPVPGFCPRAK